MAQFCSRCGTVVADGASFCPTCGNAINVVYYVKPKTPGRGAGIASMVLGIIGLVYACIFSLIIAEESEGAPIQLFLIMSVLSILAICFGGSATSKGYSNGVSKSGLATGIIGLCLYLFCILATVANY